MSKKRILIVANGLNNSGGIGNALNNMVREMYRLTDNFELDLVLFDYESKNYIADLPCNFVKVHYKYDLNISTKNMIGKVFMLKMPISFLYHRLLFKFHYILPLLNDTADSIVPLTKEYDLAIAYNCVPSCITSYVASSVKAKKKVAWAHIDMDQKYARYYGKRTVLRVNNLEKYGNILKEFDSIYAVSKKVKESILNIFSNNLHVNVFLNFVNKDLILSKSKEPIKFVKTKGDIILLTVARLSLEKGIKLSLGAANILKERGCSFKWIFIGSINEQTFIEKYIKKHHLGNCLELIGIVNNPYPYFGVCDIYVHTSYVEGYCTAINEARILSKPIVATDVSGVREQVIDGINGIVVANDSLHIANAIQLLIDDNNLREQIANNNCSLSISNHESSLMLSELINKD